MNLNAELAPVLSLIQDQMTPLPGGEIPLRDDRKKIKWVAQIAPFSLAKVPVTQEVYTAITQQAPATFQGSNHPVENVSWKDAVQFCNLLSEKAGLTPCYNIHADGETVVWNEAADGYRLPTDAEWEYACRAGTRNVRHGEIEEVAWYKENAGKTTHSVGEKLPNEWGLYDMLGNVWEWCWDIYDAEVYGSYRIIRGGGWADPPRGCLASNRRRSHPTYAIDDLGFRIARSLVQKAT